MKDADRWLVAVHTIDRLENNVVIANERRNIVILPDTDAVPTVVSEVVDHHVVVVREQRPERVIKIGSETTAVAHEDPGT